MGSFQLLAQTLALAQKTGRVEIILRKNGPAPGGLCKGVKPFSLIVPGAHGLIQRGLRHQNGVGGGAGKLKLHPDAVFQANFLTAAGRQVVAESCLAHLDAPTVQPACHLHRGGYAAGLAGRKQTHLLCLRVAQGVPCFGLYRNVLQAVAAAVPHTGVGECQLIVLVHPTHHQ